jgi:hypothetical protein
LAHAQQERLFPNNGALPYEAGGFADVEPHQEDDLDPEIQWDPAVEEVSGEKPEETAAFLAAAALEDLP